MQMLDDDSDAILTCGKRRPVEHARAPRLFAVGIRPVQESAAVCEKVPNDPEVFLIQDSIHDSGT
jgi:hypothetical protein